MSETNKMDKLILNGQHIDLSPDYQNIRNKPKINGVDVEGNKTLEDFGIATKESVETVSEKVAKLPYGIYYGQYDDVESLPDTSQLTQKGYAYVATTDANIFYIYTYNGEGHEWEDSGNKFDAGSLEDNLESKSTIKAPTTKIVAEGIEGVDLTKAKTPSTELTSIQKYNANANISNRIADVEAETGVVKALGYRVLNPNLSFAEQVESTQTVDNSNMIFEIKDSFDLGVRHTAQLSGESTVNVGDYIYVSPAITLASGSTITLVTEGTFLLNNALNEIIESDSEDGYTFTATSNISVRIGSNKPIYGNYHNDRAVYYITTPQSVTTTSEKVTIDSVDYYLSEGIALTANQSIEVEGKIITPDKAYTVDNKYTAVESTTVYVCASEEGATVAFDKITADTEVKVSLTATQLNSVVYYRQQVTLPAYTLIKLENGVLLDNTHILKDKMYFNTESESITLYVACESIVDINYITSGNVVLPKNIILKFNGGKIVNATIDSDGFNIASDNKCFDYVLFKGDCVNQSYELKWWISKFAENAADTTNDCYTEFQSAVYSGIKKLIIPTDKYIYVSKTIVSNSELSFFADNEAQSYVTTRRTTINQYPCIFSTNVVTLLDIHFKAGSNYKSQLHIGKFNLYCSKEFTDLSEKDVPILKITNDHGGIAMWGIDIWCNIFSFDRKIDDRWNVSYTGINIDAKDGETDLVRIYGYIAYLYKAFSFTDEDKALGDLVIHSDTYCVIGFNTKKGSPIKIYGSHQPLPFLPKEEAQTLGYFNVYNQDIYIYGNVWDTSYGQGSSNLFQTVAFPIVSNGYGVLHNVIPSRYSYPDKARNYPYVHYMESVPSNSTNLLELSLGNTNYSKICQIDSLTLNGENILTSSNVFNLDNIFNPNVYATDTRAAALLSNGCAFFKTTATQTTYLLRFKIDSFYRETMAQYLLIRSVSFKNLKVKLLDANKQLLEVFDITGTVTYYPNNERVIPLISKTYVYIEVSMTLNSAVDRYFPLPFISIPCQVEKPLYRGAKPNIFTSPAGYREGITYYSPNEYKMLQILDNQCVWRDTLGYKALRKNGTSAQRPSLTSADAGYPYYDTTLKKPIYWSGSAWVDANGETVGLQVSDTSVLIGSAADSTKTVSVYYGGSTAPTITVLNSDDTANTWLTATLTNNTLTLTAAVNSTSAPRGAKVLITLGDDDLVIINVVQSY